MIIHPALNNLKAIRLLGFSNGNKNYKDAKGAVDKKWQHIKPLSEAQIKECINKGHWVGGIIPEGFILVDIDNKKTWRVVYEGLLKAGYSFIGIETPNGGQFLFKDADRVKTQISKQLTLCGIVVDYKLAGKGYIVLPTENTPGRQVIHNPNKALDPMPLMFLPVRLVKKTDTELDAIPDGARTTTLISHASKIREWNIAHSLNLTEEEKRQILNEVNSTFCYPPKTQSEIDSIFKSAESYKTISNPDGQPDKKPTQVETLLKIASTLVLFHDQNKTTFTYLDNATIPLSAAKLKNFLSYRYYQADGKAPNTDSLNQALSVLNGKALFEAGQVTLHNRIAESEGVFWYDLSDGRAVRITPEGWEITSNVPILFRRYSHQQKQVEPLRGNAWDVFKFLNVDEQHHLLVLVYLISCFVPEIPHPIFHPHGQHGAGKTTFCNVLKKLIDPSSVEAIITPRDATQLVQVLAHHHICLFDNMSDLPAWMSDILAQACTGGGFQKRQLFTDDEDVIFQIKRCIGLNGINLLISRSDLMDRSILLHLERIDPLKRKEEKELWAAFEKYKAGILGGIFTTLSRAMAVYPNIQPKSLPRMADFAKWGFAITKALGRNPEEFISAYDANIKRQNEEVISNNTLALAVLQLLADKDEWQGTIKQAYQKLFELADPKKTDNTFPKSERSLKKRLNLIKTNLTDKGISFTIGERTSEGIPIAFQQIGKTSTLSTSTSSPNELNVDNADKFGTSWKSLSNKVIDFADLIDQAEIIQ